MRSEAKQSVDRLVKALVGRKVYIKNEYGSYDAVYVNSIIIKTVPNKDKHPSAQIITESLAEDIKFEKP
jgi:hypothetical protein